MKWLCVLLPFLVSCGRADASTTDLPTLSVTLQADSARVIATWKRPCDSKGCADAYSVRWSAREVVRTRTLSVLADTFFVARPAVGDSTLVSVVVTSQRRGIAGTARTATTIVRNPDAPPPAVDELRTDTLSALAAELDSFPVIVARDTLGRSEGTLRPSEGTVLCGLARNRYTGDVRLFIPADAPPDADAYLARVCEKARLGYLFERGG